MQKKALAQKNFVKSKKVVHFTKNEKNPILKAIQTHKQQSEVKRSQYNGPKSAKKSILKTKTRVENKHKRASSSTKPSPVHRASECRREKGQKVYRATFSSRNLKSIYKYTTDKFIKIFKYHLFLYNNTSLKCTCLYVIRKRLLESNDIESNPGPDCKTFEIVTYNVNGLKDYRKQKRIFNHLNIISKKGNVLICMQETHLSMKDCEAIKYHWKGEALHSPGIGASAGVSIFYIKQQFDEIINEFADNEGRMCNITARKKEQVHSYINIYAPNNHQNSLRFFIELGNHIQNLITNYNTTNIYICGDFNVVLNHNIDSVGRNQTNNEKLVVDQIKRLMTQHNLIDSYRVTNKWGGFTWGRDNPSYLRSRLDIILIPKINTKDIKTVEVNATPKESDHSWLTLAIHDDEIPFGKGILRCNSTLLNDQQIKQNISDQLQISIEEMPDHWNPHQRLDFLKVKIRDNMIMEGRKKAKVNRKILEHVNLETERLRKRQEKLLIDVQNTNNEDVINNLIKDIDEITIAINIAEAEIIPIREAETDKLIFRSRAKWAEEGKKSTKYFMNLLKQRQKKNANKENN
jgi:exonuclease III